MLKQRPAPAPSPAVASSRGIDAAPARTRFETRTLVLLFAAAFAVRLAGIGWSLPQVYEEAKPLRVAWDLWGWDSAHGFDGNPHFFRYPTLVIYLQFLAQKLLFGVLQLTGQVSSTMDLRVLWATDKTVFFLFARTLSAMFGAALVPATWALARRMSGSAAAWAAAALVAIHPMLISRAQEVEVDIPLALFVTLGGAAALRLLERVDLRTLAAAGLCAGLAASSKYTGAILLLPCALAIVLAPSRTLAKGPGAVPDDTEGSRTRRRHARVSPTPASRRPGSRSLAIVGSGLVVLLVAVSTFAMTSPFVFLDSSSFLRDLAAEREHMALGHFGSGTGPALGYYARALAGTMLGWPLLLLAMLGVVVHAVVRRDPRAIVPSAMVIAYVAIVGTWSMRAERYLVPLLPTLIALAMAGAAEIVRRVMHGGGASARWRALAWGLVCLLGAAPLAFSPAAGEVRNRWKPDTRTEALRWIHRNVPEGALVVVEQYAPELSNYTMPDLMGEVSDHLARSPRRPRIYAIQQLPMLQVAPERTAAFYDIELYRAADLVIVTSSVRARYLSDRVRFARQCAFYDSLDRRFTLAHSFQDHGRVGPSIAIYRNPDHDGWFSGRERVPGPATFTGERTGMENYFFWNLGVNYESAGFFGAAIECYRTALSFAPRTDESELYASIATRLAYCLLATRPQPECLQTLADALRSAHSDAEFKVLSWVGERVARSPEQFASSGIPRFVSRVAATP